MLQLDPKIFSVPKEGNVFELGQPLYQGVPHHSAHAPFIYSMGKMHNDAFYEKGLSAANDFFASGTHTGTHIDAIGHISCNGHLHGGFDAEENQSKTEGLKVHSIMDAAPIIKRGVLLDIARFANVDILDHDFEITADVLESAVESQGIELKKNDAVLVRTGWANHYSNPRLYLSGDKGVPGVTESGARWLVQNGMSITGSDTVAYEKQPTHELPVHRYLLMEQGIHIMEVLNLEALASSQVYEFLFICLPLRIKGGTGSPIRPIAIA